MTKVLPSYAKFMDISVTTRLLLVVPGLDPQTSGFLKANQVLFVEGQNLPEVGAGIKQVFR